MPELAPGLAERILATQDRRPVPVHVPEWDLTVHLVPMNLRRRNEYLRTLFPDPADRNPPEPDPELVDVQLVIFTACDAEGRPIFGPEHAEPLRDKSGAAIATLALTARRLSGLDRRVEDLAKNSGPTANVGSPSGSPSPSG